MSNCGASSTMKKAKRGRAEMKKEGEMLEWLKRHAWKACIRQKRIRGSNPRLSAVILFCDT